MDYGLTNTGNFYSQGQIKTPDFKFNFYDKEVYDDLADVASELGKKYDDKIDKQEERQYTEEQKIKGREERRKLIESLIKSKKDLMDRQELITEKLNKIDQLNPSLLYDGIEQQEYNYLA